MWERNLIETRRGRFEFFTQGEGEPLCITHLYSEFNEKGYYYADAFVHDFKVYLINLKEAGHSIKVQDDRELSMEETAKDLEAIREALGLEKWGFAGHSTGGMLGLVYGLHHQDTLTKLIIGGAAASYRFMEHEGSMYCPKSPMFEQLTNIFDLMNSPEATKEEKRDARKKWTAMSLYKPEKWDEYFAKPTSGKVVQKRLNYTSYYDLPAYDISRQLHHITIPSIIFCGKHDTQCPLVFSEEIHNSLPNSTLYIFENSNHSPFIEEREAFDKMVKEVAGL